MTRLTLPRRISRTRFSPSPVVRSELDSPRMFSVPFSTVISTSSGLMPGRAASTTSTSLALVTIEREAVLGFAIRDGRGADKTVFEQPIHRLSKRHKLAKGRGTADGDLVHLLWCDVVWISGLVAAHLVRPDVS